MAAGQEHYVDLWQDYKAICAKLKKRFLRKPNVSDAIREFALLGRRFIEDEESPNYAGMCHLAVARCEHQAGNVTGEIGGLTQAGRFFMEAETNTTYLGLPTFHENLVSAVHCYGHAVKIHAELRQYPLAGCLSMELGRHLDLLQRPGEAVPHYAGASRFFDALPQHKAIALEALAAAHAQIAHYDTSLASVEELWTLASKHSYNASLAAKARDCEIATVLLLLVLEALPNQMNERQTKTLQMYKCELDLDQNIPKQTLLSEEHFLHLQSIVIAFDWRDATAADASLDQLWPSLCPFVQLIAFDFVAKMQKDYFEKPGF